MNNRLFFANGNAKIDKTKIFSLPAGWSCPFAKDCLAKVPRFGGPIITGPDAQFRCYAASGESLFQNTRDSRWNNFDLVKGKSINQIVALLDNEIARFSKKYAIIRIHGSGDFFSQDYFDAWVEVVRRYPNKLFYAYTKALPFWVNRLGSIPHNLKLTASRGGKFDYLIEKHGLVSVKVVFSEKEAKDLGLKIDHDDSLARKANKNYAVLLHGVQPSGTQAAKAWELIRRKGRGGYKTDYFAHYDKKKVSAQLVEA